MWTSTKAFQFFDSKPKWHKSMRNSWAHQSQNENLFSQFLARKKKGANFLSPLELCWSQASWRVYLRFSTAVKLPCHLQMELGLIPPAWTSIRALPHSPPLQTLAASHTRVTAGAQFPVPRPKTSVGKPGELPRRTVGGTRGHKSLLLPARHKALYLFSLSEST